jgi:hypothetical protein
MDAEEVTDVRRWGVVLQKLEFGRGIAQRILSKVSCVPAGKVQAAS